MDGEIDRTCDEGSGSLDVGARMFTCCEGADKLVRFRQKYCFYPDLQGNYSAPQPKTF